MRVLGEDPNESKTISIIIPMKMYSWLENDGREINRSQLFRDAVQQRMIPTVNKVPPLMFLVSVMGIVFSIALIGIAITPTPIHDYARALLALLGGVMAVITSFVYYKERKYLGV